MHIHTTISVCREGLQFDSINLLTSLFDTALHEYLDPSIHPSIQDLSSFNSVSVLHSRVTSSFTNTEPVVFHSTVQNRCYYPHFTAAGWRHRTASSNPRYLKPFCSGFWFLGLHIQYPALSQHFLHSNHSSS